MSHKDKWELTGRGGHGRFLGVVLCAGFFLSATAFRTPAAWGANVAETPPSPFEEEGGATKPDRRQVPVSLRLPASVAADAKEDAGKKVTGTVAEPVPEKGKKKKTATWKRLTPEQVVSEDTLLYVSVRNCREAAAAFRKSALWGLLTDAGLSDSLGETWKKTREYYVRGGAGNQLSTQRRRNEWALLEHLLPFLEKSAALAVEPPAKPDKKTGQKTAPRVLFVLTLPQNDEKQKSKLQALFDQFAASQTTDVRFQDDQLKLGAYEVDTLECKELGLYESWAFVENLFLYGRGKGVVLDAVERLRHNSTGALALNRDYAAAYALVGRDKSLYAHLNTAALLKTTAAALSGGVSGFSKAKQEMLRALFKLKEPKPVAYGLGLDPETKTFRERLLLPLSLDFQGLCTDLTARFASGNALFYFAANEGSLGERLKQVYAQYQKLDAADPTRLAFQNFISRCQEALKQADLDAFWTTLAPFKGETALFCSYVPETGGKNPLNALQLVYVMEVDRSGVGQAQMCLSRLEKASGGHYKTEDFIGAKNVKIRRRVTEDKDGGAGGMGGILGFFSGGKLPFATAYAKVTVDIPGESHVFYLFSNSLDALKKALRQDEFLKTSLAKNKDFVRLTKSFREARRMQMGYLSLVQLVNWVYDSVLPMVAAFGGGAQGPVKKILDKMPPAQTLRKWLGVSTYAVSAMKEGLVVDISSATSTAPLLGVMAAAFSPSIGEQGRRGRSRVVGKKFARIGLAIHLYAADFDRFPARLSDLYPKYIKDLSVFASPFKHNAVKEPADIDNPEKTNLVYLAGKELRGYSRDVQMYEVKPTYVPDAARGEEVFSADEGVLLYHVLRLNARVNGMPKRNLERLLSGRSEITTGGGSGSRAAGTKTNRAGKRSTPRSRPRSRTR